jgi:predicted metal-dependent hydrolase
MKCTVFYSARKTISLKVEKDLSLTVKPPVGTDMKKIEEVIVKHGRWIEKAVSRAEIHNEMFSSSPEEEKLLRKKARLLLTEKVSYYSEIIGVKPQGITITGAETRFGSCSGKNRISFSFYLMRYPERAIDYVVVHELCHIIHHNHSPEFYKEIEKILPDYKDREKLLRNPLREEDMLSI